MKLNIAKTTISAALLGLSMQVSANPISDATGDFVPGYSGSQAGALDVLSALVTYDPNSDSFHLTSTLNGTVSGSGAAYIWGFNRGAGTGRFAANGLPNVLFDSTVRFNSDGSGSVSLLTPGPTAITNLATGVVNIQGNTISADIAGSLLPTQDFAKSNYTWNLWPRDSAIIGFVGISDFAPDNINAAVQTVPVPAAFWLMGSAVVGLVGLGKKRTL